MKNSMNQLKTLKEVFGFSSFRPGPGRDCQFLVREKKSVGCFTNRSWQVSLLSISRPSVLKGRTLVVSPLIALMNDQTAYLKSLNIPADQLHSHSIKNRKTLGGFSKRRH